MLNPPITADGNLSDGSQSGRIDNAANAIPGYDGRQDATAIPGFCPRAQESVPVSVGVARGRFGMTTDSRFPVNG
jgi:hypothetical protein